MNAVFKVPAPHRGPGKVNRKHSSAEAGFYQRLNKALDSAGVERFQKGRGAWLAKELKVTPAAASKWLSGDSVPERYRVEQIANLLKVSLAWLELGIAPSQEIDAALLRECILGMEEAQQTTGRMDSESYANKLTEAYTICLGKEVPPEQARNMAMIYAMA